MDNVEVFRAQLIEKLAARAEAKSAVDAHLAVPAAEARSMTADETEAFKALVATVRGLDTEVDEIKSTIADVEDLNSRDADRDALAKSIQPEATPEKEQIAPVSVRSEPIVYGDGSGESYFADQYAVTLGKGSVRAARERLTRYAQQSGQWEARAQQDTGSFSSLVVPQYLPEMFAEVLAASRVTANLCAHEGLPAKGMTLTIPRGVTPTSVAAQSGQNTAVSSSTYATTDLVVPVNTYAGQVDVSRQSLERGEAVDRIIYRDLVAQYAVNIDGDVINGPGTGNRYTGIMQTSGRLTVTSTNTSGVAIVRAIGKAIGDVNGSRLLPPDAIVMHPRRWAYLSVAVDNNNRPLVVPNAYGPQNAFGTGQFDAVQTAVGSIMGVPVWTDANVPTTLHLGQTFTNEDAILVLHRSDLHLWESSEAPREFQFEETRGGDLTVKLVIAGFSAFTAGRYPNGVAVIQGAGLDVPAFNL